jgi:hypothetical protein
MSSKSELVLNDVTIFSTTPGGTTMKQLNKILAAAFLAVSLGTVVGCAPTETKQGTGEYIDDTVITTKVKAPYRRSPDQGSGNQGQDLQG